MSPPEYSAYRAFSWSRRQSEDRWLQKKDATTALGKPCKARLIFQQTCRKLLTRAPVITTIEA